MKQTNFIKQKLAAGKPVIGIWSIINSPIVVDIAANAGLDFQILDTEHGIWDLPSPDNCIRACETMQCSPLIRVPGLQPTTIQHCLDIGAHGIIVPQIQNYQQTIDAVSAAKFPPVGKRGFNPFTRAGSYDPTLPLTATKLDNSFGLTAIILENKSVFNDLDSILKIPELDMLYLGIYDLSFDLGLNGNVEHPQILEYVNDALVKIKKAGKYSALMVKNANDIERYMALGSNCLVYGVDTNIYHSAIRNRVTN